MIKSLFSIFLRKTLIFTFKYINFIENTLQIIYLFYKQHSTKMTSIAQNS